MKKEKHCCWPYWDISFLYASVVKWISLWETLKRQAMCVLKLMRIGHILINEYLGLFKNTHDGSFKRLKFYKRNLYCFLVAPQRITRDTYFGDLWYRHRSSVEGLLLAVPARLWVHGTAFPVRDISRVQRKECLNGVGGQQIKQGAISDFDSEPWC